MFDPQRPSARAASIGRLVREAADLAVPVQCPGCGAWGVVLCSQCRRCAGARPRVMSASLGGASGDDLVEGVALGAYEGVLRRILIAAKHAPRFDAPDFFVEAGASLGSACGESVASRLEEVGEIWVVPAPSSLRRRLSGVRVTTDIARGAARGICEALGIRARAVEAVRMRVTSSSQAGRGGSARRRSREGAMVLRCPIPPEVGLVLVDDVLTTGATMRELARCVGRVDSWAVLCAVSAPNNMVQVTSCAKLVNKVGISSATENVG